MKVLLMGDASAYHATLARGLVELGHDVTVASNGGNWMGTARNIDTSRRRNKLGGALLWARLNTLLASKLKGYDVVQLCTPTFVELKPQRIKPLFDRLKRNNGSICLSVLATDTQYIRLAADRSDILRYSEWQVGGEPTPYAQRYSERLREWHSHALTDLCQHVYDHVDGVATALYEYHKVCEQFVPQSKLMYAGIPIDCSKDVHQSISADGPLRIMLACHKGREIEKGVDRMLPIVRQFAEDHRGEVEFDFVQNVPYEQFKQLMDRAHVVVDQLYSYTPATTALMAMRKGRIVVSGAEKEYYDFVGEPHPEKVPIINADPADPNRLYADLEQLLARRSEWAEMGRYGAEFVKRNNDALIVARRFEELWQRS